MAVVAQVRAALVAVTLGTTRVGTRLTSDGARVDATLDGLVADRADVEALLLKRFDELRAPARREVCRE